MVFKSKTLRPWEERKKGIAPQVVFSIYARPKFPESQAAPFRTYVKTESELEKVKDFLRKNGYYFSAKQVQKPRKSEIQVFNFQLQLGSV